ncbi:glycoside hydrolase family 51 protein [Aaosphaeria arxii CBS 175.79]|uniref:non-reducing end alpha-L-arabinofuranosidase n=1 Tax=Aaosphaeria arxii CBS 175.79 TaxID=1450172 RepID=A0A6A5Y6C3_9PLEO|nr:glycoside hydrolase family 51 protein [Aaosphaeria arxii CBS 175.79]KAF2020350.1 glycoside hydrolase family 51 protein [Aaosphaeria arxii CBS 175.79]
MISLNHIIVAVCSVVPAFAIEILVQSTGGNVTGKFGHPYGYGFLHEDINNSGDGGIYAELIQNRAFQYSPRFPVSTEHWFPLNGAQLSVQFLNDPLSKSLPASLRVTATNKTGECGFENDGYWGIDVRQQKYTGSFWVKGTYNGSFTATLKSNLTAEVFGSVEVQAKTNANEWVQHEFELIPEKNAPNSNNTFAITFDSTATGNGTLDFNLISLFPPTYKNRKNGLRVDIAEALAEMNPHFLRFPGGNMLEGLTNDTHWDWKDTLGPLKDRPGFQGVWGYQQTHGLGIMEYLEWAEDMDLQIVVGVWAGLALNGDVTPEEDLQPYIEDALNEIEFIRGDPNTPWGSKRAELGHPEPFELNYVEIGNEDWLAGYPGGWDSYRQYRLQNFYEAIHAKYPDIQVIASGATSDPAPEGATTGPNTKEGIDFTRTPGVIGDYHPYREPDELVQEFDRFDNDIGHIIGEVAATHVNGATPPRWDGPLYKYPWWIGAVGEAVSLIGYERNSDRIPGTFYAPVLKNENRFQWPITLIQFTADPKQTTRAVTWYCWSLFAHHPISHTLPTTSNSTYGPLYWGAGKDESRQGAFVWKGAVYNTTDGSDVPVSVHFEGSQSGSRASLTVLTNSAGDPYAYNSPFTNVNIVNTTKVELTASDDGAFHFELPELSVAVLDTDVE